MRSEPSTQLYILLRAPLAVFVVCRPEFLEVGVVIQGAHVDEITRFDCHEPLRDANDYVRLEAVSGAGIRGSCSIRHRCILHEVVERPPAGEIEVVVEVHPSTHSESTSAE